MVLLMSCAQLTAQTAPPAKLGACVGCHGKDGIATIKTYPNLAGQNVEYLELSLRAYQNGERTHSAMRGVVGMLSEADIKALSRYYAEQSPAPPTRQPPPKLAQ
jgi:cytochrome c553